MNNDYLKIVRTELERLNEHIKCSKSDMERSFYENRYEVQLITFAEALKGRRS